MLNDVRVDADGTGGRRDTVRAQCCTPVFLHACAKKKQVLATVLYQIAFERCPSRVVRGDDGPRRTAALGYDWPRADAPR